MQDIYLKTGKSKIKHSRHQDKCAADIYVFNDGVQITSEQMEQLGLFWESLDKKNRLGGNFPGFRDEPHFQYGK